MNRYREIIGHINYGLFILCVALLPFPQIALRYAYTLWIITWLLEGRWLQKPKSVFTENKKAIPFVLFGIWYGWKAISGLWAADSAAWLWQMERYLTFALIVPAAIWGVNRYYQWKTVIQVFAISCVVAIPFYLAVFVPLFYHREIVDTLHWQATWNYAPLSWYEFVADNISILKHRLFLCSVEIMGMIAALQVWRDRKWLLAITLPVMLSVIPLTGSRQAILTVMALLAVWLIGQLPEAKRWKYGLGIVLIGVLISGAMLKLHPRMSDFHLSDLTEIKTVNPYHDVRLNIWGCALQHPEDYLAHGLGAGQSTQYLHDIFVEKGLDFYAALCYNAHNQYLEELIEIGLPGLIFFLLIWFSIPLMTPKKGRLTALLFTILYLFNMCTDCMFGRFDGIALWAAILLIISFQTTEEREA